MDVIPDHPGTLNLIPKPYINWEVIVFIVLLSGRFCCLGFSGVIFFCCLGGGVFFFLLFGRGRVLFLLFGRGRVFFFCCLGAGREFTHLPVCLARL